MSIDLTASVIVPTAITDAMLTSCTVTEPSATEVAWVSGATYAEGDVAIRSATHRKYKRLIAGAGTTPPESDGANWRDIGATDRWKQFDEIIGTATIATSGNLVTVLRPGSTEGLMLMDLLGTTGEAVMRDAPGGAIVWSRSWSLDGSVIASVYDWMYAPYEQRRTVLATDLPGQYPSCEITITITPTASGAGCGVLAVGRSHKIGAAEYGAGAGIINWGKVTDDGFGNRQWKEGNWSDRITLPLLMNRSDFSRVHRLLTQQRSKPCIYIGSEVPGLEPLISYGVFKDLYITIPNFPLCSLNLEVEGLSNTA